jgi:Protein of unknown function (DUF3237)
MRDSPPMSDPVTAPRPQPFSPDGSSPALVLTPEMTMRLGLGPPRFVGAGPAGFRVVGAVASGTVHGSRIDGTIVGPGADWMLIGPDGFGRVDVRLQIETDDGAVIYVRYDGLIELNHVTSAALLDPVAETAWDDHYFRTTPHFETGDLRYAWLNRAVFVGRGRIVAGGLEYEVFRVE